MKFYNREKEIKSLLNTQKRSPENAQMTVVTGRRRTVVWSRNRSAKGKAV
jgi:AAA+ ATPase superfamily predicted ATPase